MCYFVWCIMMNSGVIIIIQAIIHQNKSRKGHFGVVADLLHEYNLIYPQIKQVGLFIFIKGAIWPYASLMSLFVPNYREDWLVVKGIHPTMNPL